MSGAFRRARRRPAAAPRPEPVWPDVPVTCPLCGGADIVWDLTCHTWPRTRADGTQQWMSCMPCDSAIEYYCRGEGCPWSYTHGLNPNNPRKALNEQGRPPWIADAKTTSRAGGIIDTRPGVRSAWDDDDDEE
jgi:hypothetical protein